MRIVQEELATLKASIPPGFYTDVAEIGALRDLNLISEKDIISLQHHNASLARQNAAMVEEAEKKLLDIHKLYDEKRLLLQENAQLKEECQNMRFMLQDKESLIHRLEFKLDREIREKGGKVDNGINNTFNTSKVVGNENMTPMKT